MISGGAVQVTLLSVITAMTNWGKMVGSPVLFVEYSYASSPHHFTNTGNCFPSLVSLVPYPMVMKMECLVVPSTFFKTRQQLLKPVCTSPENVNSGHIATNFGTCKQLMKSGSITLLSTIPETQLNTFEKQSNSFEFVFNISIQCTSVSTLKKELS